MEDADPSEYTLPTNQEAVGLFTKTAKNITISNAVVEVKSQDALRGELTDQYIQIGMDYTGGVNGKNLVVLNLSDAGIISSLMMGDESGAPPPELTDAHQSTIQEFVSQLLSASATQYSQKLGSPIGTSPPELSIANSAAELQLPPGNELVKITCNVNIENLVNSKFYHIMAMPLASDLTRTSAPAAAPAQPAFQAQPAMQQQPAVSQIGISPVKFPPLGEGMAPGTSGTISLLMDVPMNLTVELGRTRQLVKDILGLGEGSIIELDKLAGEPVDLLVNGKLIAKGEVVVIDENFGVRVTDIVSPAERMSKLQA